MTRPAVTLALLILAVFAASAGCTDSGQERTVLTVVPAGSLLYPLEEVEAAFEDRHPDIDVRLEGHGSIQAIRQVTDLGRAIDVVAVADASLIPDMMYIPMGEGKENYTDWYVPFAANEIVIGTDEPGTITEGSSWVKWVNRIEVHRR